MPRPSELEITVDVLQDIFDQSPLTFYSQFQVVAVYIPTSSGVAVNRAYTTMLPCQTG